MIRGARALEPIDSADAIATREDPELGMGEMCRDLRRDFQERIIGEHGDTSNALLVIARKPHVPNKRRDILPSRNMRDSQQDASQAVVAGEVAIDIGGKRVAWVHSHERHQLYQLEHSDYFDYVFYGHTHVREQHKTGRTVVANPGALFRANPKTCIVLDVTTGEIKPIMIATPSKVGESTHVMPGLRGSSIIGIPGLESPPRAVQPISDPPVEPAPANPE